MGTHGGIDLEQRSSYARYARAEVLVGRIYGKVMPPRLRKYLRRSVSPHLRTAVRGALGRVVSGASAMVEPIRSAPLLMSRRRADAVVRWKGRLFLAASMSDLTPLRAKRQNLHLVRDSLVAHRVPHFLVRGSEQVRFRVAVPATHRDATAAALSDLARNSALYVERIEHRLLPRLAGRHTIRVATRDDYFRLTRFHTDPTRCLTLGTGYGCEIEFWKVEDGHLVAPRANLCADRIEVDEPPVRVPESTLSSFGPRGDEGNPRHESRPAFSRPIYSDITFPIDVVYTWVDGNDPAWQQRRASAAREVYHPHAANSARFISHDELRYSIRSVCLNMPWIRRIYIVTDGQVPAWLDTEAPGIRVVDHREIFSDPRDLPTFNSHAIETQLHHIEGLAEHFLYLNDDVCIGAPVVPQQFFLANGVSRFFPSPALVPFGEPQPGDIPSSIAGKNNRTLIEREFGALITHKMKHVPHALRRSILFEIEERFPEHHRRTAASRFRDKTDISVTSSLYHYYAFHTHRAVPASIKYSYFDLAAADTPGRLRTLLAARDRDVFCLNDTTADGDDGQHQRSLLLPFLEAYFPVASPFERRGHTSRQILRTAIPAESGRVA